MIIPEAHLGFAVIAVYLSSYIGTVSSFQASVHIVLSQQTFITAVSVEEKSKPKIIIRI